MSKQIIYYGSQDNENWYEVDYKDLWLYGYVKRTFALVKEEQKLKCGILEFL
jgi:hypothetical protein